MSPIFEEMDRISKMRKYRSKCLAKDKKHGQLLERQPKQFSIFIVNIDFVKILCLNSLEVV